MGRIKPVPRAARRASTSPVWAALARARRWGGTSSSSEAPAKTSACSAMSSSSSLRPLRPPGTAICVEDCLGLKGAGELSRWRAEEKRNPLGGGFGSVTASGRLRATSGRKNLACDWVTTAPEHTVTVNAALEFGKSTEKGKMQASR